MIAPSLYESTGFHPASVSRRTGGLQMLIYFLRQHLIVE
jgi:hypothetical protein